MAATVFCHLYTHTRWLLLTTARTRTATVSTKRFVAGQHLIGCWNSFHSILPSLLSSSNSFSEHRRTVTLRQYLYETIQNPVTPNQKANETWYFFGETYSLPWKELLRGYELPPCQACIREVEKNDDITMSFSPGAAVALSFGMGGIGSGVQWHVHGPGWSEVLHGRKHWVLYDRQSQPPTFHPDQTSYNWMSNVYPLLSNNDRPWECTLRPGDMIYFPDMWWHATINLDAYTAFVSTFTQEHLLFRNNRVNRTRHTTTAS